MTGLVYFLQERAGGPIKIGTTVDLRSRVGRLQTGSSDLLKVLATIPGDRDLEQRLHAQFASVRLRRESEWFLPHPELMALIQGARLALGKQALGVRVQREPRLPPREPVQEVAEGSKELLTAIDEAVGEEQFPLRRRPRR